MIRVTLATELFSTGLSDGVLYQLAGNSLLTECRMKNATGIENTQTEIKSPSSIILTKIYENPIDAHVTGIEKVLIKGHTATLD